MTVLFPPGEFMHSPTKTRTSVAVSDTTGWTDVVTESSYIHRQIADELGSAIVCGQLAVGDLLPKEKNSRTEFGASRTAYREAVRLLIAKGLVESRPKVGTHVTHRRRWRLLDPDVLRWALHSDPSLTFIQELFELRGILEPHAAELAARRRSIEQLAQMGHALEEMGRFGLASPQGRAADQRFHEEILLATGNQTLIELSASICAAIHWTTVLKHQSAKKPRDAIPDHRKLYAAIVASDAARAADAARELIQLALDDTQNALVADGGAKRGKRKARKSR